MGKNIKMLKNEVFQRIKCLIRIFSKENIGFIKSGFFPLQMRLNRNDTFGGLAVENLNNYMRRGHY